MILLTCPVKKKGDSGLGERIRTLRKEYGKTQEQLAQAAECTPRQLSKIENGQVDPGHSIIQNIIHKGFKTTETHFYNYPRPPKKSKKINLL